MIDRSGGYLNCAQTLAATREVMDSVTLLAGKARPVKLAEVPSPDLMEDVNDVAHTKKMLAPITTCELEAALDELTASVKDWSTDRLKFIETLADARQNHGRVDLMEDIVLDSENPVKFAVKRMPNSWMRSGDKEFRSKYPKASERPWYDVTILKLLNSRNCPHVCDFLGIFRSNKHTGVATQLCNEGDVFSWCKRPEIPEPGLDREVAVLPIVIQMLSAVKYIHVQGIAHRDLTLENILLSRVGSNLQVKIIDYGKAALERCCTDVVGKPSYQAPEMHTDVEYDAFLADAFSLGVVLYSISVLNYPWFSTKRNTCQLFENFATRGFFKQIEEVKLYGKCQPLVDVLSKALAEMLAGLLALRPEDRAALGEPVWDEDPTRRVAVWDMEWLS
jgi:serine/threonine protein kinase